MEHYFQHSSYDFCYTKSKCKFYSGNSLTFSFSDISVAISLCVLSFYFFLWFPYAIRNANLTSMILYRSLHVWCSGTECDYSIAFSNTLWISFYGLFRHDNPMRKCVILLPSQMCRFTVIESLQFLFFLPLLPKHTHTHSVIHIFSYTLGIIHLWMDWQKIRIKLHLIETRHVWRGWRGERCHPCDLSNISRL